MAKFLRAPSSFTLLIVYLSYLGLAQAQSSSSSSSSSTSTSTSPLSPASTASESSSTLSATPNPTATIAPGSSTWDYLGCYNETTQANGTAGLRALNGGATESLDTMTVELCLTFCESSLGVGDGYAGLEYTRECYCSPYLSALATHLANSSCDLACVGNSSEICGGSLKLSVYQAKKTTKGLGVRQQEAPVASILGLGIAIAAALLLC